MKKKYLLMLILGLAFSLKAQTEDPYQYYPMAVGNYWYYSVGPDKSALRIYKDSTDINGNCFFWTGDPNIYRRPTYGYDKNYFLKGRPEFGSKADFWYKLNADKGERWWVYFNVNNGDTSGIIGTVSEVTQLNLFGSEWKCKTYTYYFRQKQNNQYTELYAFQEILAYGLGRIYRDNDANYPSLILGAIINGKTIGNPVSVKDPYKELPSAFELYQNYPNPFNPSTQISFTLKESGKVSLRVYDVLGKEVANLAEGYYEAGKHVATFNGSNLASGIYFYRLVTPAATITKKMVLTK